MAYNSWKEANYSLTKKITANLEENIILLMFRHSTSIAVINDKFCNVNLDLSSQGILILEFQQC